MKRISVIAALTCLAGLFFASSALAATADLNVTASVKATCAITGGTLDFSTLDPTNPVKATATSSGVSVTCTNGTGYTVSDSLTSHKGTLTGKNTGKTIPYSISYTGTGTGTGAAQDISISGTIAANSYTTAPADTYKDTVTLTVTP